MKKIIFLLAFLLGMMIAPGTPAESVSSVRGGITKEEGVGYVIQTRNNGERSVQDQKEELLAQLKWNAYAILITEVYGMLLTIVLIFTLYTTFSRHQLIEFTANILTRISGTVFTTIAKAVKYTHVYRALSSFFMV